MNATLRAIGQLPMIVYGASRGVTDRFWPSRASASPQQGYDPRRPRLIGVEYPRNSYIAGRSTDRGQRRSDRRVLLIRETPQVIERVWDAAKNASLAALLAVAIGSVCRYNCSEASCARWRFWR